MDLRGRMTPQHLVLAKELIETGQLGYEPWTFSDSLFAGIGYHLLGGGKDAGFVCWTEPEVHQKFKESLYLRKMLVPACNGEDFAKDNARLAASYAYFADRITQEMRSLQNVRVLEDHSKGGYMAFLLQLRGAAECVCRSSWEQHEGTKFLCNLLNVSITSSKVDYEQGYNFLEKSDPFQVVIAADSLRFVHDPLDYLHYLGSICTSGLFLWVDLAPGPEWHVRYGKNFLLGTGAVAAPYSFGGDTSISRDLLWEALRRLGFTSIQEWDGGAGGMPADFMRRRTAVWARR